MISFRNFALRRGERLLLSDVDMTLQAGLAPGRGRPQRHR
jgi:ATP-binding cassette subfamily F protein 3